MANIKTKCTDLDLLKEVLKEMGFDVEKTGGVVRAMDGKETSTIAKVKNHSFGVKANKEKDGSTNYSLAGEFWRTNWYGKEDQLASHVNREYAFKKVVKETKARGFAMKPGSLKVNKDGSKVFVMQKI
jgi:hypothetical protein